MALAYHAAGTDRIAGFYLIFSRFWELALGVLAFQLSSRPGFIATGRPAAFASLACAAVLAYAFATTAADRTPYPASLLPCGATALLLALVRAGTESRVLRSGLTSRPVVYIGRISYSLYLWHWPVYVLFRWTVGLESPVAAVIATLIAFGAASASYRYVETPPRRALAGGRIAPRAALAAAAILVAAFYPLQKSVWPLRSTISLSTVVRHKRDWYPDTDVKTTSPSGCKVRAVQAKGLDISALAFQRSACPAPSPPPPALFILGDSHASAYADLLADYVLNSGAQGMLYAKGGCAMLGQKPGDEHACAAFIDTAIADLERRVKRGDVVFLPGLRIPRIVGQHIRSASSMRAT
ncbi:MAG: acyltransferase family protein [Rhodospirillales bacterium]